MVEIRNETPLEVSISSRRTLKPLEVVDYEPGDVAIVTFYVPQWGGRFMWIAKAKLPPVVALDLATVARGQEPDALPSVAEFCGRLPSLRADPSGVCRLQVRNETIHVACAWVLDRAGGRELGRIAPGETWAHPCEPAQLWHFRTPSGLTLGVFRHFEWGRKEPPIDVALTTGFLDAWQTYQQQPARTKSKRGPGPLRLIGEQRASTPGADDQRFISASTVRLDISKEPFNGVENREVRDVEIAGSLLRWSGANRILSGYYGESNAADIRSLTIFCDRMEVADNLRFPRTNVTIHARELVFTGAGRIDTTPLPYPERARSEYLTEHPDDPDLPKVPANADGKPTYKAVDGRKGEPGGNITVHARKVWYVEDPAVKAPWVRFICHGGRASRARPAGSRAMSGARGNRKSIWPAGARHGRSSRACLQGRVQARMLALQLARQGQLARPDRRQSLEEPQRRRGLGLRLQRQLVAALPAPALVPSRSGAADRPFTQGERGSRAATVQSAGRLSGRLAGRRW